MERLFGALGSPLAVAIVMHLLGVEDNKATAPAAVTQAEIRDQLDVQAGTLSKELRRLRDAQLVTTEPGPRADQPVYRLRQPEACLSLLRAGAALDAAIADEVAFLSRVEADVKRDVAEKLSRHEKGGS